MAQKLNKKVGPGNTISGKIDKINKNDQPQQRLLDFVDSLLNSTQQHKQSITTTKH